VEGCGRLTLRCAQVWFEAVPVAAVTIAIPAQCGHDRLLRSVVEEELEPPTIEEAAVGGHEAAGGGEAIDH
jgi:hypothetical protein